MMGTALEALNCADIQSARQRFLGFCHCQKWAERMADARPFASEAALFSMVDECWAERNQQDYLEAFKAHPRIGDRKALAEKLAARLDLAARRGTTTAPRTTSPATRPLS